MQDHTNKCSVVVGQCDCQTGTPVAEADQFLWKAKESVIEASEHVGFRPEELYIVWFCKVLGNWKALVSTDLFAGAYWEVTYNGAKQETYVDTYAKRSNVCIPDRT